MPYLSPFPITQRWLAYAKRYEALTRVFFQMSANGPISGRLGFFPRSGGKNTPGLSNNSNIQVWRGRRRARPAAQRGLYMPARPA